MQKPFTDRPGREKERGFSIQQLAKGCTLTTHVWDTSIGRPASGLLVELWRYTQEQGEYVKLKEGRLDDSGRLLHPLLEGETFQKGKYELLYDVQAYFEERGLMQTDAFYSVIPVSFSINREESCHIPLYISPGGYSTYQTS
ncbi:hydroxyisourate hydrolase [Alkalicoccus luteus]|uniref:hydroxyisourate hydrolase n=1 Tax=Alkalicoccus luteus TaxID=1237094 RepID=UPI004033826E